MDGFPMPDHFLGKTAIENDSEDVPVLCNPFNQPCECIFKSFDFLGVGFLGHSVLRFEIPSKSVLLYLLSVSLQP